MNAKLHIPSKWLSRLLLIGMGLFGLTLFAQTPDSQTSTAPAAQAGEQDKKPAPAAKKEEDKHRQPDLGVAVDSGRKSDVLATWITTENNEGVISGPWLIKQSAEFGGRI